MSNYFTKEGLDIKMAQIKAQEKKVEATSREMGEEAGASYDWHDNFGYEDAKRRLYMESTTLIKLNEEIVDAIVIKLEEQSKIIKIGVTVKLLMNGDKKEFTIGAFGESDPDGRLITYSSPIGQLLINMAPGDKKTSVIGGRAIEIEIEKIFPPSYRYHDLIRLLAVKK